MATVSPTERTVSSWGSLRAETGKYTLVDTSAFEFKTKLGYLVWVEISSAGTLQDNTMPIYFNSTTASATEDDPGWFHISANISAGDYTYLAVGRG